MGASIRHGRLGETTNRRIDAEIRFYRVPFGEEEIERVFVTGDDTEFRGSGIEVDRAGFRAMHSAEIDGQFAIDEREQVVVAREREDFSAFVGELRVQFEREVVIVAIAFVAEALTVDREKCRIGVRVRAVSRIHQGNFDGNGDIDARDVAVPLIEIVFARGRRGRGIARINRFPIHTERPGDDSQIIAAEFLEIGMVRGKVAHSGFEDGIATRASSRAARAATSCRKEESAFAALSGAALVCSALSRAALSRRARRAARRPCGGIRGPRFARKRQRSKRRQAEKEGNTPQG